MTQKWMVSAVVYLLLNFAFTCPQATEYEGLEIPETSQPGPRRPTPGEAVSVRFVATQFQLPVPVVPGDVAWTRAVAFIIRHFALLTLALSLEARAGLFSRKLPPPAPKRDPRSRDRASDRVGADFVEAE